MADETGSVPTTGEQLDELVDEWLTLDEAATALETTVSRVRQKVRERDLLAVRTASSSKQRVPALLLVDGAPLEGLRGTLVLLGDARFTDEEAAVWLFTADDTLPGRPVDALREGRGREVRRRAQALGF
ncbi:DNA-binding protein [Mumia sp. zg.B53]|uniref:Rv2175c family DNA-binding protein n=1 Tax=unclassified Mumia TaxID=2621872 RepID=UPI001C6DE8F3|nr:MULTISPECIES: Rv2175c family DNA-binding protein [unclassified Mumia]MBW9206253.1 DNA-binding protein [Mumia sp. zg.B17]MBW9211453.1 DNA-binding protein [Mumia sp. zg.B21]MBW9216626.1 DNA-binding protein [Mumia sp. zg.B53]MDD9349927.1 Rv2175c family DNA-binding protein [Mumia sp.]